jgi:type I restriction enzyme R subunit
LRTEADNHSRSVYDNNKAVYSLLRYGVPVKIEAGKVTETVQLINWAEPRKNDFAIAEEVTLRGNHERRPDIVLYVNGIAVSVLELKNSRVSIYMVVKIRFPWLFMTFVMVTVEGLRCSWD